VPRGADGVGGVSRFTSRSVLPYDLEFDMGSVRVERHRLLERVASEALAPPVAEIADPVAARRDGECDRQAVECPPEPPRIRGLLDLCNLLGQ
jgi:hypothetical protein